MFVSKSLITETGKDNFSKTTLPILESERKRLYISSKIDDSLPPNSLQINQCTSILTFSELPTILEETCSFSKQREGFYTFLLKCPVSCYLLPRILNRRLLYATFIQSQHSSPQQVSFIGSIYSKIRYYHISTKNMLSIVVNLISYIEIVRLGCMSECDP